MRMGTDAPDVDCDHQHATLYARDLPAAIAFYTTQLGFRPGFTWQDPPTFAGVDLGRERLFLARGEPAPRGCTVCFVVGDADALHAFHRANGVEIVEPIADREYGLRDYCVRDVNGYALSFGHNLEACEEGGPPLPIERVDVPLRLERRIASVLADLSAHKGMSLAACVEETLLHTFGGVLPHTAAQLRFVREAAARHGLDDDAHASYRFVERER
jgi:catechol 2,3-dioxygenase-like lactoylglutathione lyase family enzyme